MQGKRPKPEEGGGGGAEVAPGKAEVRGGGGGAEVEMCVGGFVAEPQAALAAMEEVDTCKQAATALDHLLVSLAEERLEAMALGEVLEEEEASYSSPVRAHVSKMAGNARGRKLLEKALLRYANVK